MSINMGDSGGLEYADHEVQVIGATFTTNIGSFDSDGIVENLQQIEPVSDRGLDSDELAELVAMYRHVNVIFDEGGEQSFASNVLAEGSLGINISGEPEEPGSLSANAPNAETVEVVDESGDDTAEFRIGTINEPGALDVFQIYASAPSFGSNGEGAGGHSQASQRDVNFRDQFGTGPFLDRTDDLSLFTELELNDTVAGCELEITYFLYWSVTEMPEGRASFSRP